MDRRVAPPMSCSRMPAWRQRECLLGRRVKGHEVGQGRCKSLGGAQGETLRDGPGDLDELAASRGVVKGAGNPEELAAGETGAGRSPRPVRCQDGLVPRL